MIPFHLIPAAAGAAAAALARHLSDEELNWLAAYLVQLGTAWR